jgi:peptide deformylase
MEKLRIRKFPDPALRKPTGFSDNLTQQLIDVMLETLETSGDGAALAASQVGVDHRLFVVAERYSSVFGSRIVRCPEVKEASPDLIEEFEGCLSFPGITIPVSRPSWVIASWQPFPVAEVVIKKLEGLEARLFQHELDHLDGRLFVDHLPKSDRIKIAQRLVSASGGM